MVGTPCGEGRYWRAMAFSMSHSSLLTMVHTATRAARGNFQGLRSTMAEYSKRSDGSLTGVLLERVLCGGYSTIAGREPGGDRHPRALLSGVVSPDHRRGRRALRRADRS